MITITYVGPLRSGKTTAIKAAIKELEGKGFICFNADGLHEKVKPRRPVDIIFRSQLMPGPLGVGVSPEAPTIIHIAAYDAMIAAADAAGNVATEAEAVRAKGGHSDEFLLIKKVSPSLFNLIDTGKLDKEIALAIGRIIGAAREQGRAEATLARPALPKDLAFPGHLVWNPKGPHRPGYVHFNRDSADKEAQRLANEHPGNEFFVMAPVAVARAKRVVQPAVLEAMPMMNAAFDLDDEIPF